MGLSELICAAVISIGMPNSQLACEQMPLVTTLAEKADVDPVVMVALIQTESNWTPTAVSWANACGLTQVVPKWTGGKASGRIKYTCEELKNPVTSITAGTQIFGFWLHSYGKCRVGKCRKKNYVVGLCGYNAGYRCKGDAPHKTGMFYAKKVLKRAARIKRAMRRLKVDK